MPAQLLRHYTVTLRAGTCQQADFRLGGKDNFAADRAVAGQVAAVYPDIRLAVRAQRAFPARAMEFLVTQAGIRKFLDIGTGLPSVNQHQFEPGFRFIDAKPLKAQKRTFLD